jgi:hypothetical protein
VEFSHHIYLNFNNEFFTFGFFGLILSLWCFLSIQVFETFLQFENSIVMTHAMSYGFMCYKQPSPQWSLFLLCNLYWVYARHRSNMG